MDARIRTAILPCIPVQKLFFYRQLGVNTFCSHNLATDKADLYQYHEGLARKSPSEVCSFLKDYLSKIPENIKELVQWRLSKPKQKLYCYWVLLWIRSLRTLFTILQCGDTYSCPVIGILGYWKEIYGDMTDCMLHIKFPLLCNRQGIFST